jgi:hypothetical protein
MAVRPTFKPQVHIFPEWEKVQCSGVLTCLSSQTSSRLSWERHADKRDFQPGILAVDVFCWRNFLTRLCGLQIGLDVTHCLLSPGDEVGAKDCLLTRLDPVEWDSTMTSIECFK